MKYKIYLSIQLVCLIILIYLGTRLVTVSADATGRIYNVHTG